jgi:hypothetical protein
LARRRDIAGAAFPGRSYTSSTVEIYINSRTGRFEQIVSKQAIRDTAAPRQPTS